MDINQAAKGALAAYLSMEKPGYAILIDAPWGSGKTHFIREACGISTDARDEVGYVSLNGVTDDISFRRALLKDRLQSEVLDKGTVLANAVSKITGFGDLGSLARDVIEDRLLKALPETLVFDDIERAAIPPEQLSGLINEFIEHQKKRVVLLVHSEAHENKDQFLKRKEKLVGRTITVAPEVNAALPAFLAQMPTGKGRAYLEEHCDLVTEVFLQAGHGNLRLLRNALRGCALVLDDVEDHFFEARHAMSRFVRTYLALSMAYARNDVTAMDIENRGNWNLAISGSTEDAKEHPLNKLQELHASSGAEIHAHSGSVMQVDLGKALIVDGFACAEFLNTSLALTNQFEPHDENPLWKRIFFWVDLSWKEIDDLIAEAEKYLFDTNSIDAGPYLHVADGILRVQKFGGLRIERSVLVERVLKRIEDLKASDGVPAADRGVRFGWGLRGRQFSYGGFASDANDDFWRIIEGMRAAQIEVFERNLPALRTDLLTEFANDLFEFHRRFTYNQNNNNWYGVPILHELNATTFAEASMLHLETGRAKELGSVFERLAERHQPSANWEVERDWAAILRSEMERIATEKGTTAEAHLRVFFAYNWKFRDYSDD